LTVCARVAAQQIVIAAANADTRLWIRMMFPPP